MPSSTRRGERALKSAVLAVVEVENGGTIFWHLLLTMAWQGSGIRIAKPVLTWHHEFYRRFFIVPCRSTVLGATPQIEASGNSLR